MAETFWTLKGREKLIEYQGAGGRLTLQDSGPEWRTQGKANRYAIYYDPEPDTDAHPGRIVYGFGADVDWAAAAWIDCARKECARHIAIVRALRKCIKALKGANKGEKKMAGWDEKGELTAEEARLAAGLTQEEWAKWTAAGYSFCAPRQNGLWGRKQAKYMARAAAGENAMLLAMIYEGADC